MIEQTIIYIYIYIYFHSVFSFVSRNFFFFIRSLFLLFFPHSYPANPPLVLSPRHCVHVCDYGCFQSEFVRSNKSCICSKRGGGVGRGGGRGEGERGETPRVLCPQSIQLNIDQSRLLSFIVREYFSTSRYELIFTTLLALATQI